MSINPDTLSPNLHQPDTRPDPEPTHVHVHRTARDCDGVIETSHIREGDLRHAFSFDDLPLVADEADATVSLTETADEFKVLHVSAPTEEGYVHIEFIECDSDCDFDSTTYRDHAAEAAGY